LRTISLNTVGETVGFRTTYPLRDVNLKPRFIGFLSKRRSFKTDVRSIKYENNRHFADNFECFPCG